MNQRVYLLFKHEEYVGKTLLGIFNNLDKANNAATDLISTCMYPENIKQTVNFDGSMYLGLSNLAFSTEIWEVE